MLADTLRVETLGSWDNRKYRADLRAAVVLPQPAEKSAVYEVVVSGMNGILETVRFGGEDPGKHFSREGNRGGYIRSMSILFNGGNPLVVTGGQDTTVRVFEASSGAQLDVHTMKEVVWSVAAADAVGGSGADVICGCDWDGEITIWSRAHPSATTWVVTSTHKLPDRCDVMCISTDLCWMAVCEPKACWLLPLVDDARAFDSAKAVQLLPPATEQCHWGTQDRCALRGVTFSADCRRLFMCGLPVSSTSSSGYTEAADDSAVALVAVYDLTAFGHVGGGRGDQPPLPLASFPVPLPASLHGASDVERGYGVHMALDPRTGLVCLVVQTVGFFVYHAVGVQIGRYAGDRAGVQAPMRVVLRDCVAPCGDESKSCVLVLERDSTIELAQVRWI